MKSMFMNEPSNSVTFNYCQNYQPIVELKEKLEKNVPPLFAITVECRVCNVTVGGQHGKK